MKNLKIKTCPFDKLRAGSERGRRIWTTNRRFFASLRRRPEHSEGMTAKLSFLYLILLIAICNWDSVAIASEQPDPSDLSAPHVIAPHQLDVSLRSIGAGSPDANTPNASVVKKSWQSRISVTQSEKDKKYRNELQRLIAQIRSIKFEPKNQEPKPVIAIEPAPIQSGANETSFVTEVLQEHTEKEMEFKPVSEKTLRMLESISQQPDQLCEAFELAEILFLSGHLKQAAMFYQQALNRKDPNDITSAQDRAWILFQIGNCLRVPPDSIGGQVGDDLLTAKKMYRQLITEYPNCPWTDLAKARQNLIDWHLNDKPQTLIAECK